MKQLDPENYQPDPRGKYVECDAWDIIDGILAKTGRRHVLPFDFFGSYTSPGEVMGNLEEAGDNPVRVSKKKKTEITVTSGDGCCLETILFFILIVLLAKC